MIIPKYKKHINRFAINFLDIFYETLENNFSGYELNLKDRNTINKIITRYYSIAFITVHSEDKNLLYHPELADKFNTFLALVFGEITEICYLVKPDPPVPENKKNSVFEYLIKKTISKFKRMDKGDLTTDEVFSKIIDYIYDEHKKIFEKEYTFGDDWELSEYTKINHFCSTHITKELDNKFTEFDNELNFLLDKKSKLIYLFILIPIIIFATVSPLLIAKLTVQKYYFICMFWGLCIIFLGSILSVTMEYKKTLDTMKEYDNYYSQFYSLGVDTMKIEASESLGKYLDPDMKNFAIPTIADFRLNLIDEFGIVIPPIRIRIEDSIPDYNLSFKIRDKQIINVPFYGNKNVIWKKDIEKYEIKIPENSIEAEYKGDKYYFVEEKFCKNLEEDAYQKPEEYFKFILNDLVFEYIDKIYSAKETFCILDLLCSNNYYDFDIYYATNLSIFDFRDIFVKIIQRGGKIKDIEAIFESILRHSKKTDDVDKIAFKVCQDLQFKSEE